jgi:hypothetical protein
VVAFVELYPGASLDVADLRAYLKSRLSPYKQPAAIVTVPAIPTTASGKILKSTEIVELRGDLTGFVLYHVTSVFDFSAGTLVNTGDQVFSGTVAGSAPVMVHDDQFRFRVNLATGEEGGKVYLFDHVAGPKVRCQLDVVGTGLTPEGNPTFDYRGTCTFRGPRPR